MVDHVKSITDEKAAQEEVSEENLADGHDKVEDLAEKEAGCPLVVGPGQRHHLVRHGVRPGAALLAGLGQDVVQRLHAAVPHHGGEAAALPAPPEPARQVGGHGLGREGEGHPLVVLVAAGEAAVLTLLPRTAAGVPLLCNYMMYYIRR